MIRLRYYPRPLLISSLLLSLAACTKVKDKVHETVSKSGEVVGQGATEFVTGVRRGVQKALEVKVELAASLQSQGITLGHTWAANDSVATNNVLIADLSSNHDFNRVLTARAYDHAGREMGVTQRPVSLTAGNGVPIAFHFPPETDIQSDSRLVIE